MSGRWCEVCQEEHGILYPCGNYTPEVLADIKAKTKEFIDNINNAEWIDEQIRRGASAEDIGMMRIFADLYSMYGG